MLRVTFIFQLSVFLFSMLSSSMLALAEEFPFPGLVTIPVGLLAFLVTEYWRRFHLAVLPASVAGVLFTFLTFADLFSYDLQERLLGGAHLLVYLSWIVFFMQKQVTQYWWICALSVLQVAVGAVLNDTGLFGALLVVYLYFAIWTLAVFSLYQARLQLTKEASEAVINRMGDRRFSSRESSPLALTRSTDHTSKTPGPFRQFASLRGESAVSSALQNDSSQFSLGMRFLFGIAMITCLSLVVSACFFLAIPRLWIGGSVSAAERTGAITVPAVAVSGFNEKVSLGEIGINLSSSKPVLEVRVFQNRNDEQIDVEEFASQLGHDEPLFRGVALTSYKNATWEIGNREFDGVQVNQQLYNAPYRQEIRLQPIGTDALFALTRMDQMKLDNMNAKLQLSLASVVRRLDGGKDPDPLSYTVYSHRQRPNQMGRSYLRVPTQLRGRDIQAQLEAENLALPKQKLKQLGRLVDELIEKEKAEKNKEELSQTETALMLEHYLGESGLFEYSLTTSTVDPSLDPIEDFLINRRSGHCEYFASALTLMLRHAGIPARLISGFKGGNLNSISGAYEVEQRHAHAWVEALFQGQWVVFDPTPAAKRKESVKSMQAKIQSWHDAKRMLTSFWSSNVIHLNFGRQKEKVFQPLASMGRSMAAAVKTQVVYFSKFLTSPSRWFSKQGLTIWGSIIINILILAWIVRRIRRWKGWKFSRKAKSPYRDSRRIEFYERFQTLCRKYGLVRGDAQTQQEFALQVGQHWTALLQPGQLAEFPGRLASDFYKVRFGNAPLSDAESNMLDAKLKDLEQALQTQPRP